MGEADKKERRFSQEQYDMLKRCSEKKDMTEWNRWRAESKEEVLLEKAHFRGDYLEGANLFRANMKDACLYEANLKRADLRLACLEGADLFGTCLENAKLLHCDAAGASFSNASLRGVVATSADFRNACFASSNLERADFSYADLRGTTFDESCLRSANFQRSIADGKTSFWGPREINRYSRGGTYTDFEGVALGNIQVDPGTKQLLEYNIRRKNWDGWYWDKRYQYWAIRLFWGISDYGQNAFRIMRIFFSLAILFAILYYAFGAIDYYILDIKDHPGIVTNLFVDHQEPVEWWLVPLRAIYFSVVTMTTLGFGDMYANSQNYWWSWLGHLVLILQVILGYVLLGALITRFAVLFTAGGPTGKFTKK